MFATELHLVLLGMVGLQEQGRRAGKGSNEVERWKDRVRIKTRSLEQKWKK